MSKKHGKKTACRSCGTTVLGLTLCAKCFDKLNCKPKPARRREFLGNNISFKSELVTSDYLLEGTAQFQVSVPHLFCPAELSIFYNKLNPIQAKVGDDIVDIHSNGLYDIIGLNNPIEQLTIQLSSKQARISVLTLHCIGMYAVPINLSKRVIIYRPETGVSIAFNLGKVIDDARGWEEFKDIEARVRHPDGVISKIVTSNNFFWRGKTLYCKLPCGLKHAISFRYRTQYREVAWSNWLWFTPKRGMTL